MYRTGTPTSAISTTEHRTPRAANRIVAMLVVAAMAAAGCQGADADAFDDQTCRTVQRLVDESADGDLDGIERQLDRLSDVEGLDDRTDLGDLEDLVEIADEDALEDIADQVDDDLGCDIDVPRIVDPSEQGSENTTPDTVAPPVTAPQVTVPQVTVPPVTVPPETAPPVTVPVAPPAPAVDGQPLAVVDIGANVPVGLDMADIAQAPIDLIAEAQVSSLPIPAGEAIGIEYTIDYAFNDFARTPEHSVRESATFVAATSTTIEAVRDAFSSAIIDATGGDFDITESSSSRDDTTQRSVELDFGDDLLRYEVAVAQSTESPGLVFIEVTASGARDGAIPSLSAAAAAHLAPAQAIGATLGWELASWRWSPGINQFSGNQIVSGDLGWAIGTGVEADVAVKSAELLALLPTPTYDDIDSDSEFYIIDDNQNWSVRHSDVFEGNELRGSYNFVV